MNLSLLLFLTLIPLQWVNVISLGSFSVKMSHLAFVIPLSHFIGSQKLLSSDSKAGKIAYNIFFQYLIAMIVLSLSILWSENVSNGMRDVTEIWLYWGLGFITFQWFCTFDEDIFVNTLGSSINIVAPVFILFYVFYLLDSGVNVLEVLNRAASFGNPNIIQHELFARVFNKGELTIESAIQSSNRHGVMIFLTVIVVSNLICRRIKNFKDSKLSSFCSFFILGFILLSLSRATYITTCLMLLTYIFFGLQRPKYEKKYRMLIKIFVAVFMIIVMVLLFENGQFGRDITELARRKFIVDAASDGRFYEIRNFFDLLGQNYAFGVGAGSSLESASLNAEYPHNFILYHWHQAGLLGLITSTFFFINLCLLFIKNYRYSLTYFNDGRATMHILAACILIAPIIRLTIAKAGTIATSEWVALALSLSLFSFACKGRRSL